MGSRNAYPRTAELVMQATVRTVNAYRLTTLMVTHNMQHALDHGHKVFMLDGGRVRLEMEGREKESLTVSKLISHFTTKTDRLLLSA